MDKIRLNKYTDDGVPVSFDTDLIVIGRAGKGISAPLIVETTGFGRGYLKDTREVDDSDDLEIAINYLGRLLGICMADEYRVLDHGMGVGLLSLDVANGEDIFTDMRKVSAAAWYSYSDTRRPMPEWALRWVETAKHRAYPQLEDNAEIRCTCDRDCHDALLLPLRIVLSLCSDDELYRRFEEEYLAMLVFDYIIGQTDRTLDNYGLIHSADFTSYSLAPLFDNATLAKPYLVDGLCSVNGMILERERILRTLMELKPCKVLPIISGMRKNLGSKLDSFCAVTKDICGDVCQRNRLITNVTNAYDCFCGLNFH